MSAPVPALTPRSVRDERRLAARLRRREPDALREVYDRYGRTTFALLVHLLRDRAAAEDVLQQVFLQVWQRAETYDPERGGLLTWILVIARARGIDELRRRVPEPRDPTDALAQAGGDAPAVDAMLEQWHLAHLLDRLPAGEADLLRRRFYRGQTQTEIAADTGLPLGTVKSRMRSALDGLRSMMEDERT